MGLRILLVSNSGWSPSGYGTQIASLAPRLREAGHELGISAFFGLQGGQITWKGIKHYPAGLKPYGADVIHLHAEDFKADIVITLIDAWVLEPSLYKKVRLVPWSPVDHAPVPRAISERLRNAWAVLAYSRFAVEELQKIGIPSYYIPHGVELDTFVPMPREDRATLRAKFGLKPDSFVVGMVAANQSRYPTRKGFERIMPAIQDLKRAGYDNLVLYLHTNPTQDMGGAPLLEMIRLFGLEDTVYLPRPDVLPMGGLSRQELAELYNSFDLYACPSMAEGFGLPLLEAQACGVPVIATDFSACKELCTSGWLIEPVTFVLTPLMAFQALPDISSIAGRIAHAYDHPDELAQKGREALDFARQYNWDTIVENDWLPALAELEQRIRNEDRPRTHHVLEMPAVRPEINKYVDQPRRDSRPD